MYPVSNSIIIKRSIAVKKSFNFHLKVTMNRIQNTKKEEPHMKITVAIDSLKGSLASMEAGNAAKGGILRVYPEAEVFVRPLADGGEGTVDALTE